MSLLSLSFLFFLSLLSLLSPLVAFILCSLTPHLILFSSLPPTFSPQNLFTFELLTELDLSENVILFLPPAIRALRSLTHLNISKNSKRYISLHYDPPSLMHTYMRDGSEAIDLQSYPLPVRVYIAVCRYGLIDCTVYACHASAASDIVWTASSALKDKCWRSTVVMAVHSLRSCGNLMYCIVCVFNRRWQSSWSHTRPDIRSYSTSQSSTGFCREAWAFLTSSKEHAA